jgi:putative sigma-54 modulation protein
MQVLVTFRHMEATDALRSYAESKVARVRKFLKRPIEAHVVLEVKKRQHCAEITLIGEHLKVNAKEQTGDLYSAIDLAMDKIERQVQKRVTKRQTRKHAGPPVAVAVTAVPAEKRTRGPRVVTERVPVEPLTVAAAVRRLGGNSAEFLIFQNEATDALCVLYRRKGGGYGLIEPELS